MIKDSKILGPSKIPSDKELQELCDEVLIKDEIKPEPKFKRGDFVFSGIDSCAVKVINSCYDEHWRYQIFDDINEYWLFEKELKKVKIGDVVYSKVWKEKVIVREFCDDKFILVANFNGKLLKSPPSLIKQIKDETKLEPKFKVGDKIITDTNMKGKIIEVVEEGWYRVEFEPYNSIPQPNGVVPEENMSLVEEETLIKRADDNGLPFNEWLSHKGAFYIPNGYEIKDENGNVINARKIVLEKKKKEYPKTYVECCKIIGIKLSDCYIQGYKSPLLEDLQDLLICRDAYWKIAGEEMGLGKPWEPDWKKQDKKYIISVFEDTVIYFENETSNSNTILVFPTPEMRDAFYENFKELIESVKELL